MARKMKEAKANTAKTTNSTTEDKDMVRDRIGELVDLNKCPVCTAHTDCFGNINGKCAALNDCGGCNGQGCVFYKPFDVAVAENKAAFKKLVRGRRYDLINKYGKQLAALGAMDDEAENESIDGIDGFKDFEAYEEADYQEQLEQMEQMGKLEMLEQKDERIEKAGEDA